MLILGPIRMARGIRSSDWANFSHSSLLYDQGIETYHHGQLRIRSRGEEVPQRGKKKRKSIVTRRTRDENTC